MQRGVIYFLSTTLVDMIFMCFRLVQAAKQLAQQRARVLRSEDVRKKIYSSRYSTDTQTQRHTRHIDTDTHHPTRTCGSMLQVQLHAFRVRFPRTLSSASPCTIATSSALSPRKRVHCTRAHRRTSGSSGSQVCRATRFNYDCT